MIYKIDDRCGLKPQSAMFKALSVVSHIDESLEEGIHNGIAFTSFAGDDKLLIYVYRTKTMTVIRISKEQTND